MAHWVLDFLRLAMKRKRTREPRPVLLARPADMPEPSQPSRSWLYFESLHTRFHACGNMSQCGGYWLACDLFFVYLDLISGRKAVS